MAGTEFNANRAQIPEAGQTAFPARSRSYLAVPVYRRRLGSSPIFEFCPGGRLLDLNSDFDQLFAAESLSDLHCFHVQEYKRMNSTTLAKPISKVLLAAGAIIFFFGDRALREIWNVHFATAELCGIGGGVLVMFLGAAIQVGSSRSKDAGDGSESQKR
jgi:hypothetical protein